MHSQQLKYYIHDESDVLRFKLAGSLSGVGVESIYQAWQTSLSIIGNRPLRGLVLGCPTAAPQAPMWNRTDRCTK